MTHPPEARSVLLRPDGKPPRALVVDDEQDITRALVAALSRDDWDTRGAMSGRAGIAEAKAWKPDLVILDVMLPDIGGLQVLQQMRAVSPSICVLFLSAKDSLPDRIFGITAGGDDYVTKPFSLEEVLARGRGLVRRAGLVSGQAKNVIQVSDLSLDEDAREVHRGGVRIDLTGTEYELLRYLMRNPRRVLSRELILDTVWAYDFGGNSHVVELYISYLRKKIDAGRPPMIHTVRGFGYVLKPAAE